MDIDFTRFFHQNANYLCVATLEGYFAEINDSFCKFLGFSKEEILSKRFVELVHPDDREKTFAEMAKLSEGISTFRFENRYLKADGTYAYFLWNADVDGSLIYSVASDITALKVIESDLENSNEKLEIRVTERTKDLLENLKLLKQSNEKHELNAQILKNALHKEKELNIMKSRFVSIASHEFRTPLTLAQSSTDLIRKYLQLGQLDKIEPHLNKIENSSNEIRRLLDDFLIISKVEENKVTVCLEDIIPCELFNLLENNLTNHLKLGQKIDWVIDQKMDKIHSDQKLLKGILSNLITNAIKYSGENTIIEVSIKDVSDAIQIEIKDQGIGIPKDEHKFMFSRFFRASNTVGIKGTGLGLSIVQEYLKLINGTISFESTELQGTCFTVRIKNNLS